MARPYLDVPVDEILAGLRSGASMAELASAHGVDRSVIRRVVRDERAAGGNVIRARFGSSNSPVAPSGHVTSEQLRARSGITYRQLDYWTRTGYLRTATPAAPGSGNARFFPVAEIPVAVIVNRLLRDGMTPAGAFRLARGLVEDGSALLAGIRIDLPEHDH